MKLTSSIIAVIALSGMSFAGGMIMEPAYENEIVEVPVEPIPVQAIPEVKVKPTPKPLPKPKPVVVVTKPSGFYLAGGLTLIGTRANGSLNFLSDEIGQDRQIGLTARLGYDFMDYLGAELRGTYGIAKDNGNKLKQMGAYLKPNYDLTDDINLYGLLGASKTTLNSSSETGFSYGAGLDYGISDKVSVFTDVVNYMEKSGVGEQWGITVGAAYQF